MTALQLQLQFLMMIFAGWVNRSQQDVIEYLQAENRVLREQLGNGRLLLTDGQRRRLARRASCAKTRPIKIRNEIGDFPRSRSLLDRPNSPLLP